MKRLLAFLLFELISLYNLCLTAQDPVDYIVFEGAGIRGIAYCGALMELEERGLVTNIKGLAGTSSGAITASLYAVGYTPNEIFALIGETDFQDFNDGGGRAVGGFYRLKKKLGWYKGNVFLTWLEQRIADKTGNPHITFRQLDIAAQTNKSLRPLFVAATSMNHQTTLFFNAQTFPDMRIADAVRASMAVPFYFEPLIINLQGQVCVPKTLSPEYHLCLDGGFTANFCITAFDSTDTLGQVIRANTLGLRIDSDDQIARDQVDQQLCYQNIQSTSDLMKSLYYITKENMNRAYLTPEDWARTVSISDAQIGPKVKKLSPAQKAKLIDAGRFGVKAYCAKKGQ